MTDGREFSDDEVARILARASERQAAEESRALVKRRGTTLEALEEAAREAGIDPEHVRAAALELAGRLELPAPVETKFGIPDRVRTERFVRGEISTAEWGRMVGVLREQFGVHGLISDFGEVREWVSSNVAVNHATPQVKLHVEPADGGTRITLEENTSVLRTVPTVLGVTFGAMAAVMVVLNLLLGVEMVAVMIALVMAATGAVSGLGGMKLGAGRAVAKSEELEGIADRLELIARTDEESER